MSLEVTQLTEEHVVSVMVHETTSHPIKGSPTIEVARDNFEPWKTETEDEYDKDEEFVDGEEDVEGEEDEQVKKKAKNVTTPEKKKKSFWHWFVSKVLHRTLCVCLSLSHVCVCVCAQRNQDLIAKGMDNGSKRTAQYTKEVLCMCTLIVRCC